MNESQAGTVLQMNRSQDTKQRFFPEAIGHEKILAACKKNRVEMELVMNDGNIVTGQITQFDRWTITLIDYRGEHETFFKHAIRSFRREPAES